MKPTDEELRKKTEEMCNDRGIGCQICGANSKEITHALAVVRDQGYLEGLKEREGEIRELVEALEKISWGFAKEIKLPNGMIEQRLLGKTEIESIANKALAQHAKREQK